MLSYLKFRWNRRLRRVRNSSHRLRLWAVNYLNRHVFGAWQKLAAVKWLFLAWLLIVTFSLVGLMRQLGGLDKHYLVTTGARGGSYIEGLVGEVRIINPILPENSASSDVASLIFSGLTRVNGRGGIEGDLAEHWEAAKDLKSYTFTIKPNVFWHDGVPLTTSDVGFTIDALQNPDSRSPLAINWQGVKYEILSDRTIKFNLPNSYGPFLSATTVGILPRHLLESIKPSLLRLDEFNQKPVGSGPYMLDNFNPQQKTITLKAYQRYHNGVAKIEKIKFVSYGNTAELLDAYAKKQIIGLSQIQPSSYNTAIKFENLAVKKYNQPAYVGLFLNLNSETLSNWDIRRALAYATDRSKIISDPAGLSSQAMPEYYPLLAGFSGFNSSAAKYKYDLNAAKQILNQAVKNPPTLNLVTRNSEELVAVANQIREQWNKIGVSVRVTAVDLDELQQSYIRPRKYDVLLYGENLGSDSDAYNFWHSSQVSDPGLNLSAYKNADADKVLESARLTKDSKNRAAKYASFVDLWAKDIPAIILYSPSYLYGQSSQVMDGAVKKIIEPSNRFYKIEKWAVRQTTIHKKAAPAVVQ